MTGSVELGELYDRACTVAKQATLSAPDSNWSLEDIAPRQVLTSVFTSYGALIPITATLAGCVEGLTVRDVSAVDVEAAHVAPPPGMQVTNSDLEQARARRAASLRGQLDDDARDKRVSADVGQHMGDAGRLSSSVIAVMIVTGEAAGEAKRSA